MCDMGQIRWKLTEFAIKEIARGYYPNNKISGKLGIKIERKTKKLTNVILQVLDIHGRVLAELPAITMRPGATVAMWDIEIPYFLPSVPSVEEFGTPKVGNVKNDGS
jgi:hypothetical protein